MSVSGISSSSLYTSDSLQNTIQKEFQQLGQDLQSDNLSAAQSDFATLQSLGPQSNSTSSSQSSNPLAQAFNQLEKDMQSGNLSAAQKDFKTIQQDFKNRAAQQQNDQASGSGSNAVSQLFEKLGQELQSGNLSSAQQTFSSLQQEFSQSPTSRIACRLPPDCGHGSKQSESSVGGTRSGKGDRHFEPTSRCIGSADFATVKPNRALCDCQA